MPRRQMFIILAAVLLGVLGAGGWFFWQNQKNAQSATATTSVPASTPADSMGPSSQPSAAVAASHDTVGEKKSNPNPDLTVDANGLSKATVTVVTNQGTIKFKLYPKDAPATVKRMVELINQGFYNGVVFHRVVPNFVIQTGDPTGTGSGGSGQHLKAEFNERRHLEGTVAMARASDPDSADSQFYITLAPQPHLDKSYTVFGQVIEGMDAVRKIQVGDKVSTVTID